MKIIKIYDHVGDFAENKDIARELRTKEVLPELENGRNIVLDFAKVDSTTQSFVHALISDTIRKFGNEVLDRVLFKNCNITVQKIIGIVTDYMQEGTL